MRFTKGLHRCLRCDLTHGLRRQALFWLGGIGIVLIACLQLTMRHHSLSTAEYLQLEPHLTYGDYVFYLLHGMPEFVPGDQNFVPNLVWLLLHLYLACLIGSYPQRDLLEIGVQLWPRCGSRCAWWISKCIWTAVSCLLFYLLILGVPWLFLRHDARSPASAGNPAVFLLRCRCRHPIRKDACAYAIASASRLHQPFLVPDYPGNADPAAVWPARRHCRDGIRHIQNRMVASRQLSYARTQPAGKSGRGQNFSFFPARPVFLPLRRLPKNRPA